MQRITICATAGGKSGFTASNGTGAVAICAEMIACGVPLNGGLPVSISYARTPTE